MSTSADKPKTSDLVEGNAPTQPSMRAVVARSEADTRRIKPVKPREQADDSGRYSQVYGRSSKSD